MAHIIDFYSRRELQPAPAPDKKISCGRCGADVWTILQCGQVCCADCDEICLFNINFKGETTQ